MNSSVSVKISQFEKKLIPRLIIKGHYWRCLSVRDILEFQWQVHFEGYLKVPKFPFSS